jgi:3-hydroxyacyl-[acyl-carrier-protein] dehydratase
MLIENPADWIPHRPPILSVDSVDVVEPGVRGRGSRRFTATEPWLQGHFPDNPVVPGVALIEGVAQTAALVLLAAAGRPGGGFLADVSRFRFKKPVVPPVEVVFEVEIAGSFGALKKVVGRALCGGEVAAEGELVISAEAR